jgi:hypothetical protein
VEEAGVPGENHFFFRIDIGSGIFVTDDYEYVSFLVITIPFFFPEAPGFVSYKKGEYILSRAGIEVRGDRQFLYRQMYI